MSQFDVTPEIQELLNKLATKYDAMGQDMVSYLDGLLYSDYITYWDYIHLDTLLSLQTPRTNFPDEQIFIVYHQITELYFKLIQTEIDQLINLQNFDLDKILKHLQRVNNYFKHLGASFDVMTYGMDQKQFLKFRMALLPASGFQTVQYREIEIKLTDLYNLTGDSARDELSPDDDLETLYESIYFKLGGRELKSGKKTLTLKMFEEKYDKHLLELAHNRKDTNLRAHFAGLDEERRNIPELKDQLRELDLNANVFWRLSHYKAAARYLQRDPVDIAATGGTNWQKYLPPRFQRIIFFPELWTEEQKAEWGKAWVLQLFEERVEGKWSSKLRDNQQKLKEMD